MKRSDTLALAVIVFCLLSKFQAGTLWPPSIASTPDRVTYVYEKDNGGVPIPVQGALGRLNADGKIVATSIDISSVEDGTGEVPDQYKAAIATAKEKGIPILVVQQGDKVLRTVAAPKTAEDVEKAL